MIILIAEYIASASSEQAKASIRDLIGSVPKTATVRRDGQELQIPIEALAPGDLVLKAGERIPVDGEVVRGQAAVNQAPITGENVPVEKAPASSVYAGTILESGALDIRTEKLAKDTLFAHIIALVEEAEANQAPIQKFTDRVATYLIPIAFLFVGSVYLITRDVRVVIALLIFTSPAELGLATPLVTIAAIARAAREGLLVKGGIYLEEMAKVTTVVFDKTGTLTLGRLAAVQVSTVGGHYNEAQLLAVAAAAERRSGHPVAKAITARAAELHLVVAEPSAFAVQNGRGLSADVGGRRILIGNRAHLAEHDITTLTSWPAEPHWTTVYVAVDTEMVGAIHLADRVRPGAKQALAALTASGVKRLVLLSGDDAAAVKAVADEVGIADYHANLLPEDKIKLIKGLQDSGEVVAMVGDGINDAPALAQANVGIAMGLSGIQAAMEAADIVLMKDDLAKLVTARQISQRAYRTIKENIIVGVGLVHVIGITLVLLRIIGPIQAAAIHLGPDTLVFINSTKLLRVRLNPAHTPHVKLRQHLLDTSVLPLLPSLVCRTLIRISSTSPSITSRPPLTPPTPLLPSS